MYTPDHWCNIPQNYSDLLQISNQTDLEEIMIPIDKVTLKKSQCFMYNPDSIGDGISSNSSQWQTIKCMHGWQYNFTGYYTSISTKFDWVCDDSWKPHTAQSIYFAGAIIGTLALGWMMDHYGRVWTIRMATVNILITGFATPFVNGFFMFAVFRFLMGLSYPTFFICTFMLSRLYMNTLVI